MQGVRPEEGIDELQVCLKCGRDIQIKWKSMCNTSGHQWPKKTAYIKNIVSLTFTYTIAHTTFVGIFYNGGIFCSPSPRLFLALSRNYNILTTLHYFV